MIRSLTVCFFAIFTTVVSAEPLHMAVTTSFDNSGLADVLLPEIKADTGLDLRLLVVGTGQALRLGAAGDVDAVLVHARDAEDAFLVAGHGVHRREIMYNDYVLIGPDADPAGIRDVSNITQVMIALHETKPAFVSRGDDSGTHKAERRLWAAADLNVSIFGDWYRAVGAGMGAALNTASAMNAYIIADRASWLNFGNKGDLALLFEGDPALFNQYAYLPVNPNKGAHIRHADALKLEAWLTSERAQALIDGYQINGQQLFTFNAN